MKNNSKKETIIIDKDSLKNYKKLSLGLENCENFNIDISDVIDIFCKVYKYSGDAKRWYNNCYHTSDGYIKISSRARNILSDFAYVKDSDYIPQDYDEEDYKLYKRMSQCDDMCSFSLLDGSDRWKHIYVPYGALEEAIHRSEIDYANCPSFRILENGDMEIRFGKLSENPIITRNNYSDLIDDWKEVLGKFSPKMLKLKVNNCIVQYSKNGESTVELYCTILNKKSKNEDVIFKFCDCDKINIGKSGKIKTAHADMTKLCNGNIYFGIDDYFWISCRSCKVLEDWERTNDCDD
ncbi:MAG: hypothetical protein K2O39_07405 [Clostridiales bacterium]|nr:hypothetical protein [Clostridiales bacterium]